MMDNADGVRLRPSTVATNEPIAYPPGDMSVDNHDGIISTRKRILPPELSGNPTSRVV
jgi:hypothetical protein